MHRHIRAELGVAEAQGKRYSWGYPACPDLEQHTEVFKLLPAADALGMELSVAGQLIPEQSTAAIVVHHPEAKYYVVREARGERREAKDGVIPSEARDLAGSPRSLAGARDDSPPVSHPASRIPHPASGTKP
ncbi:MAG TPA: vitamin B12 dependent-methionine synthase activation domain-containing protein, partial [Gemmatimonadaceae bacterium]